MDHPLLSVGWAYDDETGRITGTFRDLPPVGHPDPISWMPTTTYTLELPGEPVLVPIASIEHHDEQED